MNNYTSESDESIANGSYEGYDNNNDTTHTNFYDIEEVWTEPAETRRTPFAGHTTPWVTDEDYRKTPYTYIKSKGYSVEHLYERSNTRHYVNPRHNLRQQDVGMRVPQHPAGTGILTPHDYSYKPTQRSTEHSTKGPKPLLYVDWHTLDGKYIRDPIPELATNTTHVASHPCTYDKRQAAERKQPPQLEDKNTAARRQASSSPSRLEDRKPAARRQDSPSPTSDDNQSTRHRQASHTPGDDRKRAATTSKRKPHDECTDLNRNVKRSITTRSMEKIKKIKDEKRFNFTIVEGPAFHYRTHQGHLHLNNARRYRVTLARSDELRWEDDPYATIPRTTNAYTIVHPHLNFSPRQMALHIDNIRYAAQLASKHEIYNIYSRRKDIFHRRMPKDIVDYIFYLTGPMQIPFPLPRGYTPTDIKEAADSFCLGPNIQTVNDNPYWKAYKDLVSNILRGTYAYHIRATRPLCSLVTTYRNYV